MENLVVDVDGNRICLCERGGFHSGVLERSNLLECKAVYNWASSSRSFERSSAFFFKVK